METINYELSLARIAEGKMSRTGRRASCFATGASSPGANFAKGLLPLKKLNKRGTWARGKLRVLDLKETAGEFASRDEYGVEVGFVSK